MYCTKTNLLKKVGIKKKNRYSMYRIQQNLLILEIYIYLIIINVLYIYLHQVLRNKYYSVDRYDFMSFILYITT